MDESGPKIQKKQVQKEHVEVTKSEIRDEGDSITFTFRFAQSVDREDIDELWDDAGRTVQKTINNKLAAKGWQPSDSIMSFARPDDKEKKQWTFYYQRDNPEVSPTVH